MGGKNEINILFTGDYYPYPKLEKYCREFENSSSIFGDLLVEIKESDIAGINIEFPITTLNNPIEKIGPNLKGDPITLKPIVNAGFNLAYISNNHILDHGKEGMYETVSYITKAGIKAIGFGRNLSQARKIHIIKIRNTRISFLNFSENEFNIAKDNSPGANPLNLINNVKDIRKAKTESDFVFVIVHAGQDFNHYPPPYLLNQLRFYTEEGASAIICHHSHYISGYEVYKGAPIFYGLGNIVYPNFVENERQKTLVIKFIIKGNELDYNLMPYYFDTEKMRLCFAGENSKYDFTKQTYELSRIIENYELNKEKWYDVIKQQEYYRYLIIIGNFPLVFFKIFKKLKTLHLLEYLFVLKKKQYFNIWNLIRRETHRDAILHIFEEKFNN